MSLPEPHDGSQRTPCSVASSRIASGGVDGCTVVPTAAETASDMPSRGHGSARSTCWPAMSMTVVPTASRAALTTNASVSSITSDTSPNAWYDSIIVNSGLWVASIPSLRNVLPISKTRSKPPTMSRLRCSSVATRRYSGRSSVLWWVTNGLAWAPPGSTWKIGVSTSTNPRSSSVVRKLAMTAWRISNTPTGVGVDGEVGIALAVANVGIGESVPLVGQRADRLGQQLEVGDLDGDLAGACCHHRAGCADPVAAVERFDVGELVVTDDRLGDEQLDVDAAVGDGEEDELAGVALEHHATGDRDGDVGLRTGTEVGAEKAYVGRAVRAVEAVRIRLATDGAQLVDLTLPPGALGGEATSRRRGRVGMVTVGHGARRYPVSDLGGLRSIVRSGRPAVRIPGVWPPSSGCAIA